MSITYDECPYCGRRIIKGAMKCMGCGKILKTAAEQQASIDRYTKSQQGGGFFGKMIKVLIFLLVIAAAWYAYRNYRVEILSFINGLMKK